MSSLAPLEKAARRSVLEPSRQLYPGSVASVASLEAMAQVRAGERRLSAI